jgi:hypothetical protein
LSAVARVLLATAGINPARTVSYGTVPCQAAEMVGRISTASTQAVDGGGGMEL